MHNPKITKYACSECGQGYKLEQLTLNMETKQATCDGCMFLSGKTAQKKAVKIATLAAELYKDQTAWINRLKAITRNEALRRNTPRQAGVLAES